jgi:hypothetical protein
MHALGALAHAVACRRRDLDSNQISTIANGAFAGLTALTDLYDAGLWGGRSLLLTALFMHLLTRSFWRRDLHVNQISTVTSGAFGGLTALTDLYDAGLWVGWSLRFVA